MPNVAPIYTAQNCTFSCPLEWGVSVFWRTAERDDSWCVALAEPRWKATESDCSATVFASRAQVNLQ